ncbi:hypothetical protein [Paludisphaera soli]|uniref:hypothetical protein n=1 Tax=Paludisphaera soli TaxID=2712865 RepID=UPI0013EB6FC7|nr:hypothetical protein [Paludisphaera soli]
MKPTSRRRRASAALILGLGLALSARDAAAQQAVEAPIVIPPPRPPVALPAPVVIEAPADEVENPLDRPPLDPVALEKKGPHFFFKKIRSWPWRRVQGKMLGYPEDFKPRPLGSSVYAMGRTMTANGAEARLALYDYDFVQGSAELSERGRDQLELLAAQLAASPYPLIVERTPGDPALAGARRRAVLDVLTAASFPIEEGRVLVGQPIPFGMSGVNAQIISANILNRTQQYGPPVPINANGVNSPSGVTNQMVGAVPGQ